MSTIKSWFDNRSGDRNNELESRKFQAPEPPVAGGNFISGPSV